METIAIGNSFAVGQQLYSIVLGVLACTKSTSISSTE